MPARVNRGFEVQWTTNLRSAAAWQFLEVPDNRPFLAASNAVARVPDVLHQMDVAVAPYPRLSGFYFSPLKIFEYMAAGVPVAFVESNGSWCTGDDLVRERLTRLREAGVEGM